MDRSPALEGKDGGRGSGSWPRTPRFAVGDEVEVLFTGSGFRGARFEATVTARFPDSGRYEVVYSELIVRRDGPPLREVVGVSELRPRPPPPQPGRDRASSSCLTSSRRTTTTDGGRASCPTSGPTKRRRNQAKRFAVSLPLFREVLELSASFVRPRREFVYGSWIDAQEVVSKYHCLLCCSIAYKLPFDLALQVSVSVDEVKACSNFALASQETISVLLNFGENPTIKKGLPIFTFLLI